jgi:hypothetical protein
VKPKKYEIKDNGISILIYAFSDGRFCVDTKLGGARNRITRTSLEGAKIEARRLLAQVASGRGNKMLLTRAEVEEYRLAKAKIEKYELSLLNVVKDWIASHQRAKSLVRRNLPELVEEFLAEKEFEGVSRLHLADRKSRLRKFAGGFQGRVDRITTAQIKVWMREFGQSRRTQKNYRDAILQLFRYA